MTRPLTETEVSRLYTLAALGARKARADEEASNDPAMQRTLRNYAAELNGITRVLELALQEARHRGSATIQIKGK